MVGMDNNTDTDCLNCGDGVMNDCPACYEETLMGCPHGELCDEHIIQHPEPDPAQVPQRVIVKTIPFDAPGLRHTVCGDWVEGDHDPETDEDLLVCKTCGLIDEWATEWS